MKKFILIFLAAPFLSQAQSIPGYLGKRQVVSFDFNFIPSFVVTNNEDMTDDIAIKMTYKNGISYDFISDKSWSYTGSLDFTQTYMEATAADFNGYDHIRNPKISSIGIGAGIKIYLQHLAPLGSHLELKLLYRNSYVSDYGFEEEIVNGIEELNVSQLGFGIGYMKSRVFNDHFVFSYGMNLNMLLSLSDILFIDTAPIFNLGSDVLKDNIKTRIQLKETIYMKFSIGYLL